MKQLSHSGIIARSTRGEENSGGKLASSQKSIRHSNTEKGVRRTAAAEKEVMRARVDKIIIQDAPHYRREAGRHRDGRKNKKFQVRAPRCKGSKIGGQLGSLGTVRAGEKGIPRRHFAERGFEVEKRREIDSTAQMPDRAGPAYSSHGIQPRNRREVTKGG